MDALRASYGGSSSDSDSDPDPSPTGADSPPNPAPSPPPADPLPPPPLSLLNPPNHLGTLGHLQTGQPNRLRSFPHVEGNYALHVYIPVFIPQTAKTGLAHFLKKVSSYVPGLHVVDIDIPLDTLCNDDLRLENVALGREFHISLGRTVPIRVHQIDSVVTMLRQKLQFQKRYWIDFTKWEVFVNDDSTRTFLSIEVTSGGLVEITREIQAVNNVYRLHNLPEFYKDPRPHISLVWAFGDVSDMLRRVVAEEIKKNTSAVAALQKRIFTVKFSGIECKIGNKTYRICKMPEE
ncbi:hypothetical protein Ancab_022005 [Ancistrocladus abbreviatus]